MSLSARRSLPCSAANLTCIAPVFLQQLGLQISAFHLRTHQAQGLAQVVRDLPLPNHWKHSVGVLQRELGSGVSATPHSGILSPHSILGLRPPPSRSVSLLSPSSPPRRSIQSFHTTTDAPGSYLSSLQHGCDIASTAASSPEPFRPRGHPESPPPAGAQCLPPSNVLHDLTVSSIPSLL